MVSVKSFIPRTDPIENIHDVISILVPTSMWEVLIIVGEKEKCSPGEVLDRALCQYLPPTLNS